jgi:hypothetical protein
MIREARKFPRPCDLPGSWRTKVKYLMPTRVGLSLGVPKLAYTPDSRSLASDWKRPSLQAIQLTEFE